ncbi:MAG TPA: TldD/PmbA family protein, partial [Solirubrobacteraceae bacterium]|nr:TldD/PmbA family protein [Solirubrobacteraceae bacterium]
QAFGTAGWRDGAAKLRDGAGKLVVCRGVSTIGSQAPAGGSPSAVAPGSAEGPIDLLTDVVAHAPASCTYAEARWVENTEELLAVVSGRPEDPELERSRGVGVRVRARSGWGFSATDDVSKAGLRRALERAVAIAEAQPSRPSPPLAPIEPAQGHWSGPCRLDPFALSLESKLELLTDADAQMRTDPRIVRTEAECRSAVTRTALVSSEGVACSQTVTQCGGGIRAFAVGDGEAQVRSYPSAHGGSPASAGWEQVLELDLSAHAPRVADEALALLTAPPCPSGQTTVILHDEQLALQVHESIGHALELDRILLGEASYAGTSWVQPEDLGKLRYGSSLLNVTADATLPGGLGTFMWDDEGVAGRRTPLIEGGVLVAALSDRSSAAAIGLPASAGCARADGFARQPIVRMTNVSLEPGDAGTLEDLIADTQDGLYLEGNRSWSIDDRRLHFQFATEVGREIRRGRLGRLYRNASYAGVTPEFWRSLDGVCSALAWRVWGLLNCGKGEPGQIMHVSHGAAPGRFRGVEVGVA